MVVVVGRGCAFLVAKTELLIGHQGTEVPCMTNGKHWDGWACGDAQLRCTFIIDFFMQRSFANKGAEMSD